jgi:hypothetical protein
MNILTSCLGQFVWRPWGWVRSVRSRLTPLRSKVEPNNNYDDLLKLGKQSFRGQFRLVHEEKTNVVNNSRPHVD